jgi:hypothetical protein
MHHNEDGNTGGYIAHCGQHLPIEKALLLGRKGGQKFGWYLLEYMNFIHRGDRIIFTLIAPWEMRDT